MTTTAPERPYEYQYRPPSPYRAAISAAVVIGATVALLAGLMAWQRWTQRAPYGPEAVDAHLTTMRVVPEDSAQAAVDALTGVPGSLRVPEGTGPLLVGQVTYDVPAGARGTDAFSLFVLDAHQGLPLQLVWGVAPRGGAGQGWDGSYDSVAQQVPWLSGIADVALPDGSSTDAGMSVGWRASTTGPVTFVAVPLPGMLGAASPSSYTVGLTLQNGDRTLYWAERLTPTAPS